MHILTNTHTLSNILVCCFEYVHHTTACFYLELASVPLRGAHTCHLCHTRVSECVHVHERVYVHGCVCRRVCMCMGVLSMIMVSSHTSTLTHHRVIHHRVITLPYFEADSGSRFWQG